MANETELERLIVRLMGDASSYNAMMASAKTQARTLSATMTALGTRINSVGQSLQRFGRTMSLYVTAPLALIGGTSLRAFANFDEAMIKSTSIMRSATEEQKARMRSLALSMSDAVQSPKELGDSYYFLASAGKDAEQSMALLPVVARFATAGAFDMARATDLLTDAQSALGLSVKDAAQDMENMTRLGDLLVGANTLANASVEQFSTALTTKAGAAFKSYNIQLEEGLGLLAAYADQGIKAELAGNAVDRVIRLLTKALADNTEEFYRLEVKVFDAQGEFLPFKEIIGSMERALRGMSTEQKAAALELLGFEARIQSVILPLLGTSEKIGEYVDKLKEMGGMTKAVAEDQLKSFSNQMRLVWKQLNVVGIEIGEILAPRLAALAKKLEEVTKWWKELSAGVKTTYVNMGMLLGVIGPLALSMGAVVRLVGWAVKGLGTLVVVVTSLATALATPVGLLVAMGTALAAATAALVVFRERIASFIQWLSSNWNLVLVDMGNMVEVFLRNMLHNTGVATTTFLRMWASVSGWISGVFEKIFSKDMIYWVVVGSVKLVKVFEQVFNAIAQGAVKAFLGQGFSTRDLITRLTKDFLEARKDLNPFPDLAKIWNEQVAQFKSPLEGFESVFKETAPDSLTKSLEGMWDRFKKYMTESLGRWTQEEVTEPIKIPIQFTKIEASQYGSAEWLARQAAYEAGRPVRTAGWDGDGGRGFNPRIAAGSQAAGMIAGETGNRIAAGIWELVGLARKQEKKPTLEVAEAGVN